MTSFRAEKCRHLVSAHEASDRRIRNSVRQFLVDGTFALCNPSDRQTADRQTEEKTQLLGGNKYVIVRPLSTVGYTLGWPDVFTQA